MIELDIVSHDMFDLPPLSEYELYVKKFGADDTRQVSVYALTKIHPTLMACIYICSTSQTLYYNNYMYAFRLFITHCFLGNTQYYTYMYMTY